MSRSIPLLPLWAFVACSRVNFTFIFTSEFFISFVIPKYGKSHSSSWLCFSPRFCSFYLFLYSRLCAYHFTRVLIFLFPKPWLVHTNTHQCCMINFAVQLYVFPCLQNVEKCCGRDVAVKGNTLAQYRWHGNISRDGNLSKFCISYFGLTQLASCKHGT